MAIDTITVDFGTNEPSDWDQYVQRHPLASAYHLGSAVQIGRRTFGLKTYFLVARTAESRIAGVLPLVEQSSIFFGRFLTSLPFVTSGGILSDDETVARKLADLAVDIATERNAKHLQLRHDHAADGLSLKESFEKVSLVLPLPGDQEALSKQLKSKLRSQIRRGERVEPEICYGGAELLPDFYAVFAPVMHALGTPVYPKVFFDEFMNSMGPLASVIVIRVQGRAEAAAINVRHKQQIEVPWAGATVWAKQNSVNMRMYWEMLTRAIDDGATSFDFGRSTVDSGTYKFKLQWGCSSRQLHWHYWLRAGGALPQLNHANPRYALAIRAWQRMPLWCANLLGPQISRKLP